MAMIVSIDRVRTRWSASNSTDVRNAIQGAIEAGTLELEGLCSSPFALATVIDTFFVRTMDMYGWGPTRRTKQLLLSRGFLTGAPSAVRASADPIDLANGNGDDLVALNNWYLDNLESGVGTIENYDATGLYVRVTYQAGFVLGGDGDTEDTYGMSGVYLNCPDWLIEAGVHAATIQAEMNAALRALLKGSIEEGPSGTTLRTQLTSILATHSRYSPLAVKPFRTQAS